MKFNHDVKFNGVYYPAGTDVPNDTQGREETPAPVVSGKVEAKEEPVVEAKADGRKYSEEDLKVGFMKLKQLAKKEGIVVHPEWKSAEIKEALRAL